MAKKFDWAIVRSPKSDRQQHRVYRMESEAIGAMDYSRLSQPRMRRLIRCLCRHFKTKPVVVVFKDLGKGAAEWAEPNLIRFNTHKGTSMDLLTGLHEFAHHLHFGLAPEAKHEAHGKEFMCCYMAVLDSVRYVPVDAMKVVCERYQIRYLDPGMTQSLTRLKRLLTV